MILIADSGSSKTDWRIWDKTQGIRQAKTDSLNPYYIDKQYFISQLMELKIQGEVEKIFFYSAGCGTEVQQRKVTQWLDEFFGCQYIEVQSDMLGAARGVAGKQEAVVCIVGTGSNACLFDGEKITHQTPSNGIWFGDEGGGADIGKHLIADFLELQLPQPVLDLFNHRFGLDRAAILQSVYSEPNPAKFLAGFVPFVLANIEQPYLTKIVLQSFEAFLLKRVQPIAEGNKVHFVGGVAFRFSNLLLRVANHLNINVGRIIEKPIAGLSHYHFPHLNN